MNDRSEEITAETAVYLYTVTTGGLTDDFTVETFVHCIDPQTWPVYEFIVPIERMRLTGHGPQAHWEAVELAGLYNGLREDGLI